MNIKKTLTTAKDHATAVGSTIVCATALAVIFPIAVVAHTSSAILERFEDKIGL